MRYLILVLSALLMCVTNDGYTQNKNKKETTSEWLKNYKKIQLKFYAQVVVTAKNKNKTTTKKRTHLE